MGKAISAPDDYCGFVLESEEVSKSVRYIERFHKEFQNACCLRKPVWDGSCIWHADFKEDSANLLVSARLDPSDFDDSVIEPADDEWLPKHTKENLNGAIVKNVNFTDRFSFRGCVLNEALFSDVNLSKGDFTGAILKSAEFTDADLSWTRFREANLDEAIFLRTELEFAQFSEASLIGSKFADVNLTLAPYSNAKLSSAEFSDVNLLKAKFPDASLVATKFLNVNLSNAAFSDTDMEKSEFLETNLEGANFQKADLTKAEFNFANLADTVFEETNLSESVFPGTNLQGAVFSKANLRKMTFPPACTNPHFNEENPPADPLGASLEDVQFKDGTDLRGADLSGARLYQAGFADIRINNETIFGLDDGSSYGSKCRYDYDPCTGVSGIEDISRLQAAAWTYRRLESLFEQNAMDRRARNAHIRKEEVQRYHLLDQARDADTLKEWLVIRGQHAISTLNWRLTRHGESIRQLFISAATLILACGFLYPFVGGVKSNSTSTSYRVWELSVAKIRGFPAPRVEFVIDGPLDLLGTLLQSLYFSIITFSTIGYGDLYPTGAGSKMLVGFESLSGAILIALFVFVLGRRVAR